jgi:hypothetical protein
MKKRLKLLAMAMAIVMLFNTLPISVSAQTTFTPGDSIGIGGGDEMSPDSVVNPAITTVAAASSVIMVLLAAGATFYGAGWAVGEAIGNSGQPLNGQTANLYRSAASVTLGFVGGQVFNLGLYNGWHSVQ